jgi:hypothetical protein
MDSIKLKQVPQYHIDELKILSLGQNLYSVRLFIDEQELSVIKGNVPYRALSIEQIYQDFSRCDIDCMSLMQDNAYDEMVGQPATQQSNCVHMPGPVHVESLVNRAP